jgi:hypothetical protein
MSLLREYIKEILSESKIHPKIMSMIDKLESLEFNNNIEIYIEGSGSTTGHVLIVDTTYGARVAEVEWEPNAGRYGGCGGAAVVEGSIADHGLGPLAYEVAIEVTGGLIADRRSVSDEAIAVWDYYMKNRPDIEIVQLDNLENQLTDTDTDNCDQEVAKWDLATRDKQWVPSSLSKMYRKSGTPVLDELKNRGLVVKV